jgi:hypothetical protein
MITTTAQQIIRTALLQINAIAATDQPTHAEAADALARLNEIIDDWGAQALTFRVEQRVTASIVASQQSYTIGLTGDFNVALPSQIDNVQLLLTSTTPETEIPLSVLTEDAYQAISQKDLTNTLPTAYYVENTIPLMTLWVWPAPTDDTNELVIYYPDILAQFTSLTASVTLATSYVRALRSALAVELAPEYGKIVSPDLRLQADSALGHLKRSNVVMMDLSLDPGVPGVSGRGSYNIFTDTGA